MSNIEKAIEKFNEFGGQASGKNYVIETMTVEESDAFTESTGAATINVPAEVPEEFHGKDVKFIFASDKITVIAGISSKGNPWKLETAIGTLVKGNKKARNVSLSITGLSSEQRSEIAPSAALMGHVSATPIDDTSKPANDDGTYPKRIVCSISFAMSEVTA